MATLHDLDALSQAAAVVRREVSPVELVQHYLERIAAVDDGVGAFVTVTADRALERAAVAERAVLDGAQLPPLHGVPTALKDLQAEAGVPFRLGSRAYADFVAAYDDHVTELAREAGTISLGKTSTPEFGLPCYTEPDDQPPARTPWDTTRGAGGSSGGAGAAVAAGLAPFALGSDGGGSIRIPASVCGVVGLKPSRGRVSNGPLGGDANGLSWNGPLARTVADVAALLDAVAVPMPGDPHWAPPPAEPFLAAVGRDPGRLRVGRFRTPVIADAELDPEVVEAYEAASALLESLGHDVEDVELPAGPDVVGHFEVVWSVGAARVPLPDPDREPLLTPLTRWLRARGASIAAPDYLASYSTLQLVARVIVTMLGAYDAVLTPTLARLPAPVGSLRDDEDPAADFEAQKRFTPFTSLWNLTGQPAVSLPLHWTDDGLPVGVMLAGRPAGEAGLLTLAAQLETARPWADRKPACW